MQHHDWKRALQLAHQGDWDSAHDIVQSGNQKEAYWIHAYLHRVEGDESNARYWYNRAGVPFPQSTVEQEWQDILDQLESD